MEEFFDQLFLNCVRNLSLARSNRSLAKTALSFHAYEALGLFVSGLDLEATAESISAGHSGIVRQMVNSCRRYTSLSRI